MRNNTVFIYLNIRLIFCPTVKTIYHPLWRQVTSEFRGVEFSPQITIRVGAALPKSWGFNYIVSKLW